MALRPVFGSWPPHYFSQAVNSKDWSTYLAIFYVLMVTLILMKFTIFHHT
jgi:hypothetical protein